MQVGLLCVCYQIFTHSEKRTIAVKLACAEFDTCIAELAALRGSMVKDTLAVS